MAATTAGGTGLTQATSPVTVQKYGGTSLSRVDAIDRCAGRAAAAARRGERVVVVVSAMGGETDALVDLAASVDPEADRRHVDLLLATGEQRSVALMAMAIERRGIPAAALVGPAIGIRTDRCHANARIEGIDLCAVRTRLDEGRIVVVAGFQGVSDEGCITTLGRGGSDTTAVALAAALDVGVAGHGGACEICTDVDGVFTADPRVVPRARMIERIAYEEMVELASLGAGVLHPRAGMLAWRHGVPLHVRHSAHPRRGTMVVSETADMDRRAVVGCALTRDLGRVTLRGLPNRPGMQAAVFHEIARAGVLVDDIIQNEAGARADVAFTVEGTALADVKAAAASALEALGGARVDIEVGLSKVSAVGTGMRTHTGVAARMFRALGDADITIANITTSEIKISCIVPREDAERALRIVHDAFELGSHEDVVEADPPVIEFGAADAPGVDDPAERTGEDEDIRRLA